MNGETLIEDIILFSGIKREENLNSLKSKSIHANEEYLKATRTNSFMEMYTKVQNQLGTSFDKLSSSPSSSSSFIRGIHLSEIVEPRQENLTGIFEGSELHHFLSCFFQISFEACKICELILKSIHQTRANYSGIGRLTMQLESGYTHDQCNKIYGKIAAFSSLTNPLSDINTAQFEELHDNLYLSLAIFTSNCRKIRKKKKFLKHCKRIAGGAFITLYSALMITLIALAIHSVVGIVAAPGLIGSFVALIAKKKTKKKNKRVKQQGMKIVPLERLESQLDTAARGVYLLINDFDTMSRLVMRLNNEIQHSKFVADLCLRRRTNEMLKEVMKELQANNTVLMNQLEDLEEHVYFCILNINRSRRLVVEKMVVSSSCS